MWIHGYPNWKKCFNSKIGNKKCFYYETKASISLIPTRRMCLWCPIMKRKEIIMWIHVYPNWNTNINSKKGNRRSFSYDTKASTTLILMRRTSFWCPILKSNEITIWIFVYPNWKMYFNSKIGNRRSFSFETINPNGKNVFMIPNHEEKGNYYGNPCLSQLKDVLQF